MRGDEGGDYVDVGSSVTGDSDEDGDGGGGGCGWGGDSCVGGGHGVVGSDSGSGWGGGSRVGDGNGKARLVHSRRKVQVSRARSGRRPAVLSFAARGARDLWHVTHVHPAHVPRRSPSPSVHVSTAHFITAHVFYMFIVLSTGRICTRYFRR